MAVFSIIVNTMSEILPSSTEEGGTLTRAQKRLVQTTWKKLATNPAKHGAVMFAKLVSMYKLFRAEEHFISYIMIRKTSS